MGKLEGKVAFISGVARGQGRSHAVRFAAEGADVIGFDICEEIPTTGYPMATPEDLEETVRLVTEAGGRIVARRADVRDLDAVQGVFDEGLAEFGRADIVVANAGALFGARFREKSMDLMLRSWQDSLDVLLTGALYTVVAALPTLMRQGSGGSIVITSSTAGIKSLAGPCDTPEETMALLGYTSAKTGVVGLMRALAASLAHLNIRVNTIHPTGVNTPFIVNDVFAAFMAENPAAKNWQNAMPAELIEPEDVSSAVVWLSSDEARYVTGTQLPIDAGFFLV